MSIEFTARYSVALLLALAAGCTKHNARMDTSSAAGTVAPDTTPSASATTPALPAGIVLAVGNRAGTGLFLTDGNGRALYVLDRTPRDTTNWRPAITPAPPTSTDTSIKAGMIGTTNGPNGMQATYGGKALFYYAGDQTTADLKGDGKNVSGTTGHFIHPDGSTSAGKHTGIKRS